LKSTLTNDVMMHKPGLLFGTCFNLASKSLAMIS